jgi:hypothetical protein
MRLQMSPIPSTKEDSISPFLSARLIQARLVSEHVDSAPAQSTSEPKPVQLRTETTSKFGVALDDPKTPTGVLIQVDYTITLKTLKLDGTDLVVADYKGKHTAEFKILDWGGFEDWTQPPHPTLVPYFAMSHNVAIRRAQQTLLDMGLGQVILPVLTEFSFPATPGTSEQDTQQPLTPEAARGKNG